MADREDLEFTYSLIARIFRLSLGELADFSGAKAQRRKHEYVAEQIGIGPGRRVLDLGCGWGPRLKFQGEISPNTSQRRITSYHRGHRG